MSFQTDIKSKDVFQREIVEVPGVCQASPVKLKPSWKRNLNHTLMPINLKHNVVEVYNSWSGPCKAIISTFKRIYFEAGDRPLKFFTLDGASVPGFEDYVGKCQPVFLFYKDGQLIDKVVGVIAPALEKKIMEHSVPPAA